MKKMQQTAPEVAAPATAMPDEQVHTAVVVEATSESADEDDTKAPKIPAYVNQLVVPEAIDLQLPDVNEQAIARIRQHADALSVDSKGEQKAARTYRNSVVKAQRKAIEARTPDVIKVAQDYIDRVKAYANGLTSQLKEVEQGLTDKEKAYDVRVAELKERMRVRTEARSNDLKALGYIWVGRNESFVLNLPATGDQEAFTDVLLYSDIASVDDAEYEVLITPAVMAYKAVVAYEERQRERKQQEAEAAERQRQAELEIQQEAERELQRQQQRNRELEEELAQLRAERDARNAPAPVQIDRTPTEGLQIDAAESPVQEMPIATVARPVTGHAELEAMGVFDSDFTRDTVPVFPEPADAADEPVTNVTPTRVPPIKARDLDPAKMNVPGYVPPAVVDPALQRERQQVEDELDPIWEIAADPGRLIVQHPELKKLVMQLRGDLTDRLIKFRNDANAL